MKDAYYFPHDSNARNDTKILSMRSVYGAEGYGWYWIIIEMLREEKDYKIKMSKYVWNALAMQMQCDCNAAKKFVEDCINEFELFKSDGEYFWSESLIRRMKNKDEKSEKARKAAIARWEKSSNDAASEDFDENEDEQCERNADALQTHSERNAIKENKRKENKNKNLYNAQFERFWEVYPRKVGKKRAYALWQRRVKEEDPETLILAAENYARYCEQNKTEQRYIKHPSTFLSDKLDYQDYLEPMEDHGDNLIDFLEERRRKEREAFEMEIERNRWVERHGTIEGFAEYWRSKYAARN
ncbi:hypothetical protein BSNK01_12400 [Bacillaceae bacterium]